MKNLLYIFILTMVFTSCLKEDIEPQEDNKEQNIEILQFSSFDELQATINKVNKYTKEERMNWENQMNFKSFGSICDKVYAEIDIENINTINDVEKLVFENSKYLKLETDNTGDKYCLPAECDNEERFILNDNLMYIVGTEAFKKVSNGMISTKIENLTALLKINKIEEIIGDGNFKIFENKKFKSIEKEEIVDRDDRTIDGKTYRVKVWVQTEIYHNVLLNKTYRETEYKITNYLRRVGVWFQKPMLTDWGIELISWDERSNIERQITAGGFNDYNEVFKYSDMFYIADGLTWDYKPVFVHVKAWAKNEKLCSVSF